MGAEGSRIHSRPQWELKLVQKGVEESRCDRSAPDIEWGWYPRLQEALEAETPQTSPITLQVFESVVDPHLVCFKKSINLIAGSKSQNAAELRLSKPPLTVLLRYQCLQRTTRQIPAGGVQASGEIVGNVNG
jgi:hypothetical protein